MPIKELPQASLRRASRALAADDSVGMLPSGSIGPRHTPGSLRKHSQVGGPITDQELLLRCQARDAEAWTRLVGRYERLVFRVAVRNGLDREDAADVTQSTFAALFDSINTLREGERLPFWLMTVARRHAWRALKRAERERSFMDIRQEGTHSSIEEWERLTVLQNAIKQLPAPCRELVEALYFDPSAPSYAELAKRMDRAIGGIGPMRGRCLEHLKVILGEEFVS